MVLLIVVWIYRSIVLYFQCVLSIQCIAHAPGPFVFMNIRPFKERFTGRWTFTDIIIHD
jgi:hypothetical protein